MQLNYPIRNKNLALKVTDKELTLLYEIGLNVFPTATEFVDSVAAKHDVCKSGIWYTLKKLKSGGLVDFTEKGEGHRPLSLTDAGTQAIRSKIIDVENRHYHYITGIMQIKAGAK